MTRDAGAAVPEAVVIEIWTDLGCPWCYIGKHRLQKAVDGRPDSGRFEIKVRSFELSPNSPREPESIEAAFLRTHGGDINIVHEAERRAQGVAQREGLPFTLDRQHANTSDLHRVVHYAEEQGLGSAFFSAVQDAFFAGAVNPFDASAVAEVAGSVGLSIGRVLEIYSSDEYSAAVRFDRQEGLELGVTGVPFVVFDRRVAAPGAQSVATYERMLEQVAPLPTLSSAS